MGGWGGGGGGGGLRGFRGICGFWVDLRFLGVFGALGV